MIVDVTETLWSAWLVFRNRRLADPAPMPFTGRMPTVTVVIPAYNEQVDIDRCITSLKAQTYPHNLIDYVVVNDGSTDRTGDVVTGHIDGTARLGHIRLHNLVISGEEYGGDLRLVQGGKLGKPRAVNLGLTHAEGELIMAIDSDVVLEPDAVEQAVAAFRHDPGLAAATAHLIIDHNLLVQTDDDGRLALDDYGLPVPLRLTLRQRFLAAAQFIEYLQAFRIGRHAEASRGELFTLSGACGVFRREALAAAGYYHARTVSEDTDLTFALHRHGLRVGYLPQVRVHVAPTISWKALYAQRVRWQRGELEVIAVHRDMVTGPSRFWKSSLPLRLWRDHTLAMMRLVWLLLLPLFPLVGYSPAVVAQALGLMIVMYFGTDLLQLLAAYPVCAPSEKKLLRSSWMVLPLVQFYRQAIYLFRLSGILKTLTEPPRWTVSTGALRLSGFDYLRKMARAILAAWAD
jgi:cellulose synthase/poly-beta-1,6-N-acetylglucosamine synthase-like glycosyltransferase